MNLPARFDHTFRVEVIIASVVFGLIMAVFLGSIIRSWTRRGRTPSHKTSYKKTEAVYLSVVAAMAVFLVTFSLTENRSAAATPAMTVEVVGYQWCWRFEYRGTPVSVTADCVDGHLPTLVVPTGERIRFDVTSDDVIHAVWIPHLRYKLFAYPHYVNTFETTFTQAGTWAGECSEFCGTYHYAMHFYLRAEPPAQFRSWLQSRAGAGR